MYCGAKTAEIVQFSPAGHAAQVYSGAKTAEIAHFGPAGCVIQDASGAKSAQIATLGPAGCAGQVLSGAKSAEIAHFGPAAERPSLRHTPYTLQGLTRCTFCRRRHWFEKTLVFRRHLMRTSNAQFEFSVRCVKTSSGSAFSKTYCRCLSYM